MAAVDRLTKIFPGVVRPGYISLLLLLLTFLFASLSSLQFQKMVTVLQVLQIDNKMHLAIEPSKFNTVQFKDFKICYSVFIL